MADLTRLEARFHELGKVMLGYSGGVDSALLGVVGSRTLGSERFLAVMGVSPSYAEDQRRTARAIAARFEIPLLELDTHELEDDRYAANPTSRCYFCKTELWTRLRVEAEARGFDAIVDGTNRDDLGEHRPGLRAAEERGVVSPLAELGWTKADIRAAARRLDIPVWDAPAQPCLASRIEYGLEVTASRLRQVEEGEAFLRQIGVAGELRVRHHGPLARLETDPVFHTVLQTRWGDVVECFQRLGFDRVEIDPRGYRRGGLLVLSRAGVEAGA